MTSEPSLEELFEIGVILFSVWQFVLGQGSKLDFRVHADLQDPVVLDPDLDRIDKIGSLVAGLDGLGGEFGFVGDPGEHALVLFVGLVAGVYPYSHRLTQPDSG